MPKWRAIIFDLDDTLYPERDYVFSGFQAVAGWAEKHLAKPASQVFEELKELFERGVRHDTFNQWLNAHHFEATDELVSELVQVYREHAPRLAPFPGLPRLLDSIGKRYLLGLLSDGYSAVQESKLGALGLAHYFDAVVFSDQWGREAWKPSGKPFKVLLSKLGVSGPEAVYVADNPIKDFLGARLLGLGTVRLRIPQGLYADVIPPSPEHAPDFEINDLNALEYMLFKKR